MFRHSGTPSRFTLAPPPRRTALRRPGNSLRDRRTCDSLLDVLAPHSVIAVGRTAELALHRLGLNDFAAVRHPSHGGKRAFIAGLTSAGLGAPLPPVKPQVCTV